MQIPGGVLKFAQYLPQVPLKYLAISKFSILPAKNLGLEENLIQAFFSPPAPS